MENKDNSQYQKPYTLQNDVCAHTRVVKMECATHSSNEGCRQCRYACLGALENIETSQVSK